MIYARVDVELRDHPRAHQAGAAMATWTWMLLYTRRHELDGYVPAVALRGAWVGEEQARRDAATLITAGLCAAAEGGYVVVGYASKNETRSDIEDRREAERKKKAAWRAKRDGDADARPAAEAPPSQTLPKREDQSQSQSQSQGHPRDTTGVSPVTSTHVSPVDSKNRPTPIPEFFVSAVETVEMSTGEKIDRAAAWLRYSGHREAKGKPMSQPDAKQWLITVDVKEAKRERDRRPALAPAPPKRKPAILKEFVDDDWRSSPRRDLSNYDDRNEPSWEQRRAAVGEVRKDEPEEPYVAPTREQQEADREFIRALGEGRLPPASGDLPQEQTGDRLRKGEPVSEMTTEEFARRRAKAKADLEAKEAEWAKEAAG